MIINAFILFILCLIFFVVIYLCLYLKQILDLLIEKRTEDEEQKTEFLRKYYYDKITNELENNTQKADNEKNG